jgi:hypothetical protein
VSIWPLPSPIPGPVGLRHLRIPPPIDGKNAGATSAAAMQAAPILRARGPVVTSGSYNLLADHAATQWPHDLNL